VSDRLILHRRRAHAGRPGPTASVRTLRSIDDARDAAALLRRARAARVGGWIGLEVAATARVQARRPRRRNRASPRCARAAALSDALRRLRGQRRDGETGAR
jgi:hypothetical protein